MPIDTDINTTDTRTVAATGVSSSSTAQGAAGPENLASPIQINANFGATLLDSAVSADAVPNRTFDFMPVSISGNMFAFGTVVICRRFTNTTGGPIYRLRFRLIDLAIEGDPQVSFESDMHAMTSVDQTSRSAAARMCWSAARHWKRRPHSRRAAG